MGRKNRKVYGITEKLRDQMMEEVSRIVLLLIFTECRLLVVTKVSPGINIYSPPMFNPDN